MSKLTQTTAPETGQMRLHKFLSYAGCCSRRQGEDAIVSGRVTVNGHLITTLGTKINPETDRVELDGKEIKLRRRRVYIALNKPRGYVTSCRQVGDKIVMTLVNIPERVFPIGRLDKESEGLLLLTNDGTLHHQLSHPSFEHEKEYKVTTTEPISDESLQKLRQGVSIGGYQTRPANVVRLSETSFRITLKEGKNRQIRRMLEAVGHRAASLKRIRIACIRLGQIPSGAWRYLTPSEQTNLVDSLTHPNIDSNDKDIRKPIKAAPKYTKRVLLQKKKGLG